MELPDLGVMQEYLSAVSLLCLYIVSQIGLWHKNHLERHFGMFLHMILVISASPSVHPLYHCSGSWGM